ncbi:hypothetical protein DIPPA_25462 [Diplonema papillatum]|nr:hypothetical protein DIPPA_25462 [Diplonema papillatum]
MTSRLSPLIRRLDHKGLVVVKSSLSVLQEAGVECVQNSAGDRQCGDGQPGVQEALDDLSRMGIVSVASTSALLSCLAAVEVPAPEEAAAPPAAEPPLNMMQLLLETSSRQLSMIPLLIDLGLCSVVPR